MGGRIGPWEIGLILLIALVFFGPKKLPELGKAIGSSLKEFKKATKEMTDAASGDEPAQPATDSGVAKN